MIGGLIRLISDSGYFIFQIMIDQAPNYFLKTVAFQMCTFWNDQWQLAMSKLAL
jgi:hypothetical protein